MEEEIYGLWDQNLFGGNKDRDEYSGNQPSSEEEESNSKGDTWLRWWKKEEWY